MMWLSLSPVTVCGSSPDGSAMLLMI
ncbi:MAG: hypothetical protein RL515_657, partial [Verrucomicrobiota bacterium]